MVQKLYRDGFCVQCGRGFEGDILIFVFSKVWFRKGDTCSSLGKRDTCDQWGTYSFTNFSIPLSNSPFSVI